MAGWRRRPRILSGLTQLNIKLLIVSLGSGPPSSLLTGFRPTVSGRQNRTRVSTNPPNPVRNYWMLRQPKALVRAPPTIGTRLGSQRRPSMEMPHSSNISRSLLQSVKNMVRCRFCGAPIRCSTWRSCASDEGSGLGVAKSYTLLWRRERSFYLTNSVLVVAHLSGTSYVHSRFNLLQVLQAGRASSHPFRRFLQV
jgi:hypothetical protein